MERTDDHTGGHDGTPPWESGVDVNVLHQGLDQGSWAESIVDSELREETNLGFIDDFGNVCGGLGCGGVGEKVAGGRVE